MQIDYYDADAPETEQKFSEVMQKARERGLVYPLVLMNGELAASGGCDPYQIMFLVDRDRREKGLPARY